MPQFDRRQFLELVGVTALGLAIPSEADAGYPSELRHVGKSKWNIVPELPRPKQGPALTFPAVKPAPSWPGRIVEARAADLVVKGPKDHLAGIARMLERALQELTGKDSAADALAEFFGPGDIVGIKLSCSAGATISSHLQIVAALVELLKKAGIPPEAIIVWDRFSAHLVAAGFRIATDPKGLRVIASEPHAGYDPRAGITSSAGAGPLGRNRSLVTRLVTTHCTKQIHIPVLKDHGIAGISGALKGASFGSFSNTARFHRTGCMPLAVSGYAMLRDRFVLTILDGLIGLAEGGPTPISRAGLFRRGSLWVSTDPVAIDSLAFAAIEEERRKLGYRPLRGGPRAPKHVFAAADAGLGVFDASKMERQTLRLKVK